MTLTIWHNPRCSKSRETLALLQAHGQSPTVRLYLEDPPSLPELFHVLALLDIPACELVRTSDTAFGELNIAPDASDDALLAVLAANPRLIERPLVINGAKAALGRPPAAVLKIL